MMKQRKTNGEKFGILTIQALGPPARSIVIPQANAISEGEMFSLISAIVYHELGRNPPLIPLDDGRLMWLQEPPPNAAATDVRDVMLLRMHPMAIAHGRKEWGLSIHVTHERLVLQSDFGSTNQGYEQSCRTLPDYNTRVSILGTRSLFVGQDISLEERHQLLNTHHHLNETTLNEALASLLPHQFLVEIAREARDELDLRESSLALPSLCFQASSFSPGLGHLSRRRGDHRHHQVIMEEEIIAHIKPILDLRVLPVLKEWLPADNMSWLSIGSGDPLTEKAAFITAKTWFTDPHLFSPSKKLPCSNAIKIAPPKPRSESLDPSMSEQLEAFLFAAQAAKRNAMRLDPIAARVHQTKLRASSKVSFVPAPKRPTFHVQQSLRMVSPMAKKGPAGEADPEESSRGRCGKTKVVPALEEVLIKIKQGPSAIEKLTIPELKVYLKSIKKPVGGKKCDLVDRVKASEMSTLS